MITWVQIPPGELTLSPHTPDRFRMKGDFQVLRNEKALWVSDGPITEEQWAEFEPLDSPTPLPKVKISFAQACRFADWASGPEGQPCRLLTSEEWEYACRAGTSSLFSFGDHVDITQANFLYSEDPQKVGINSRNPPGSYPPNAFGLYDMHGNVCEWTSSDHRGKRVVRGGAWDYLPRLLRSSWWGALDPATQRDNLGVRIAAEAVSG